MAEKEVLYQNLVRSGLVNELTFVVYIGPILLLVKGYRHYRQLIPFKNLSIGMYIGGE